jgi:hypothetical protein
MVDSMIRDLNGQYIKWPNNHAYEDLIIEKDGAISYILCWPLTIH